MYSHIDECISGLIDYYETDNVYDLVHDLGITLIYLDPSTVLLKNTEAFYNRHYNGDEAIFLRNNLNSEFEKFIIAHELGHALLHTEISTAAFANKHTNTGKLEKHANYFAVKLTKLEISEELFNDLSCEHFIALVKSHFNNY